jgi:hemerythrin
MWNDGLKIGVPLIDSEHKELCSRIDQLLDACNKGQGRAEIVKTVAFLEEYTIKHFFRRRTSPAQLGIPEMRGAQGNA